MNKIKFRFHLELVIHYYFMYGVNLCYFHFIQCYQIDLTQIIKSVPIH